MTECKLLNLQSAQAHSGCEQPNTKAVRNHKMYFWDILLLFAHQRVNSPTAPTNHSHRGTERATNHTLLGRTVMAVCVCASVRVCARMCVKRKSFASFHACMCCNPRRVLLRGLTAADIRDAAVFFPFLRAQTISSQFEFLHLGAHSAEQIRCRELNEQELPLTFLCSS